MPVTIALFDLGSPELPDENSAKGGETDGVPFDSGQGVRRVGQAAAPDRTVYGKSGG
jgi:hypothetical protein